MVELTKRERRLAEVSVKRYHTLLYRKAPLFEWVGCVLIFMSFLRFFPWLELYRQALSTVGFVVLLAGNYVGLMGLVGKLYEEILRKEESVKKSPIKRPLSREKRSVTEYLIK
jgi:hypothetical protein